MRLGQLAREFDLQIQEIITYLMETYPHLDTPHSNYKLEESELESVIEHFNISLKESAEHFDESSEEIEVTQEVQKDPIVEEDTLLIESNDVTENTNENPDEHTQNGESIETDKLLELLESEEESIDLSKITLIKAPKKELEGLKVVGKIDLPEPTAKSQNKESEKEVKADRPNRNKRPQLSEEEREKRRLKAKRKKEAYEARQEKLRKEREQKKLKALKEAHYREKLAKAKTSSPKAKSKPRKQERVTEQLMEAPKPVPKTTLGKFWRWLNT